MSRLKTIDFISIFIRSFFIQAVWNFKSLISIGLCFSIVPVVKRLAKSKDEYKDFLKRHLCFFNSHPYFASYAIGAIARLEEECFNAPDKDRQQIDKFKNALIGPLGAIGDQYFWAVIKPASILIGFTAVAIIPNLKIKLILLVVFLILYNIPHLYIRAMGLWRGYKNGYGIYKLLKFERFSTVKNLYQILGAVALGLFIGFTLISSAALNVMEIIIFVICALSAFLLRTKKQTVYLPILLPLILATILGSLIAKV